MGNGSGRGTASLEPSAASSRVPPDSLTTDSIAVQSTSETPITKSKETGRKEDDAEDETVTVTYTDNAVAQEAQTVKANNEDPSLTTRKPEPLTRPISYEQLVAEVKGIYAGLTMVEAKCMEVDAKLSQGISPETLMILEKIPYRMIELLQYGNMEPEEAIRIWLIKAQKDTATEGDEKPSNLSTTSNDQSTASDDHFITPEEVLDSHVLGKSSPQVLSLEDCLSTFQVALELRTKELEWPESLGLAKIITEEIGEEGRKMVIDRNGLLDIGYDLVDRLLQDMETAAEKKAKIDEEAIINNSQRNTKKTDSKKPSTTTFPIPDLRVLYNQLQYKKIGSLWFVLINGIWYSSLRVEQFQALVALHRTLLYEQLDFFEASQHSSASPALKMLATKYAMPARMWHGVHSFLEVLRKRHPVSQEYMDAFIILAYNTQSLLDESVLAFDETWIEFKGDLARYRITLAEDGSDEMQHWEDISREQYTRVLSKNSANGRIYHHLAILARPHCSKKYFDGIVSQFFYGTKALVVKTPCFSIRESLFIFINPILAQNKTEKRDGVPQTDKANFLTVVSHLILASLGPELLRKNGYKTSKEYHLQAFYMALRKIGCSSCSAEEAKSSRIRPSPELGLLLCQLLLGIPGADGRWSPMMAAWAPDLVTKADRADTAASMANARDIHDATIEMLNVMIPYLLKDADTRDLRVWGFIYVILVFMRSLKTRPDLLKWFGFAFHAKRLAPFVNMLLREDETRGSRALEGTSQSELFTLSSLLNQEKKRGDYGLTTEDNIKKYQEECRKAEGASNTVTVEDAMATKDVPAEDSTATPEEDTASKDDNTVNTEETASTVGATVKTGDPTVTSNGTYTNVLPEHGLLQGHFFAREAESDDKSLEDSTKDAILRAPEATSAAGQGCLLDLLSGIRRKKETQQQNAKTQEEGAEDVKHEEERKKREAEEAREAEVRKQEAWLRDPPLFPEKWFAKTKHNYDESQIRMNRVQDPESCNDRSVQIIYLVRQLMGVFFMSMIDEEGRYWISVPGALCFPQPDPNMKMPEVIERGGTRIVYVHPSFHDEEIEREMKAARLKERRAEHVEDKEKMGEHTKVEVETTLPLQDVDSEIATATTGLQPTAQLTKGALAMLGPKNLQAIKHGLPTEKRDGMKEEEEDEGDDWTHISNESREAAPTAQADRRSMISSKWW